MSEYLDKAKRIIAHDDGPTTLALIAIAEQMTRIADMMEADRKPETSTDAAPLTDEPPVGSMVTADSLLSDDDTGICKRSPDGWHEWHRGRWVHGAIFWDEMTVGGTYHLTTDAERKAAGIPDEDPDGRARNDDEQCGARHPANSSIVACMLKQGHNGDHQSSTGCAGSAAAWAQDDLAAAAHRVAKEAGLVAVEVPLEWAARGYYEAAETHADIGFCNARDAFLAIAAGIEAQEGIE